MAAVPTAKGFTAVRQAIDYTAKAGPVGGEIEWVRPNRYRRESTL